jgi:signal transduction histidine kinase
LLGYPNELRQVFSNLVLNAFEASPVNSTMTVRVREYVDSTEARGIRISIADHGSGIAAGSRSRIFEPFFTTKQGKGTGLGLWVSDGIVQTHGGKIRVRSRVEGATGTCISILLPYNGAKSLRSLAAEGAVAA